MEPIYSADNFTAAKSMVVRFLRHAHSANGVIEAGTGWAL